MSNLHGKPSAVYANRMQRYPDTVWLIWSNKRSAWYRPESAGYTGDITKAGLFDRDEAAQHMRTGPRKYRDTEPFPMAAVRQKVRRAVEAMRAEVRATEARLAGFLA